MPSEELCEELREPVRKNPFYVSPWMYELLPKECEAIAKNYFNGEVVVLPRKYEEGSRHDSYQLKRNSVDL